MMGPSRHARRHERLTLDPDVPVCRPQGHRNFLAVGLEASEPRSIDEGGRNEAVAVEHEALVEGGLAVGPLGKRQSPEALPAGKQRARPAVPPKSAGVPLALPMDAQGAALELPALGAE